MPNESDDGQYGVVYVCPFLDVFFTIAGPQSMVTLYLIWALQS